jgi:hypothetical protein
MHPRRAVPNKLCTARLPISLTLRSISNPQHLSAPGLTPLLATLPKNPPLSLILATLPKTCSRNPFVCHTCETPRGVPCPSPGLATFSSYFLSFHMFPHSLSATEHTQILCHQSFPHSFPCNGGGVSLVVSSRSLVGARGQRKLGFIPARNSRLGFGRGGRTVSWRRGVSRCVAG